ncbi:hypothetical protein ACFQ8C_10210 [Streptomyces sp. NPDC056503]|uniref:hypothetical protein n=1 Tax=Streptomyces sp. NPDC056503 TaxID=3345842 RepID=UPI0036BC3B98
MTFWNRVLVKLRPFIVGGRKEERFSIPAVTALLATIVTAFVALLHRELLAGLALTVSGMILTLAMGASISTGPVPTEEHQLLMRRVAALSAMRRVLAAQIAALADAAPGTSRSAVLNRADLGSEVRAELQELYERDAEVHQQLRAALDALTAYRITHSTSTPPPPTLRARTRKWGRVLAPLKLSSGLTSLAVSLAGRRREESRLQWRDQLEGAPEDGIVVSPALRVRYSIGFVIAALHYRLSDVAAPGWRVIDWLLARHSRTNSLVASAVGAQAIYITWAHDLDTLLTEGSAWLLATGGGIVGVAVWLRKNRGIEPTDAREPAK